MLYLDEVCITWDDGRPTTTTSFPQAKYSVTYGTTFTAPTATVSSPTEVLSFAEVTYTSSNVSVATVNSSTGAVTITGSGTTTITATYPGNGNFGRSSASYTLIVNKAETFTWFPETSYIIGLDDTFSAPLAKVASFGVVGTAEKSYTSLVMDSKEAWHGKKYIRIDTAPYITTDDGRNVPLVELWQPEAVQQYGEILWQDVTGLENGTYAVTLYANAYCTTSANVEFLDDSYVFANGQKLIIPAHNGSTIATHGEYTLITKVTNGTLHIGIGGNEKRSDAINWWSIQIKSLTKMTISHEETISNPTLNYKSSKTSVATVNSSTGTVTIKGAGTTTITATYVGDANYESSKASYTLTVNKVATTTTFPQNTYTTAYGSTFYAPAATVRNGSTIVTSPAVTYKSRNTNIAKVDSRTGTVTIKGAGTTTIAATYPGNSFYQSSTESYTLTVNKIETTTSFPQTLYQTGLNDTFSAPLATVIPFEDIVTSEESCTPLVMDSKGAWHYEAFDATINYIGSSTAPYVTTDDGRNVPLVELYYSTLPTSTDNKLWNGVTGLENGTYAIELYANAYFTKLDGVTSTITEGQEDIAYIFANDAQQYIPVHIGSKIATHGEYTLFTEVTDSTLFFGMGVDQVGPNWWSIQIKSLKKITIDDETVTAPPITYQSSNPEVAEVNSNTGAVTLIADGTTTITATFAGNANYESSSSSYTLKVGKDSTSTSFPQSSYSVPYGSTFTAPTPMVNTGSTTIDSPTLTYSSNNTAVAIVDSATGSVTIIGAGTTTITATYAGNSNYAGSSASYTLTVNKAFSTTQFPQGSYNVTYGSTFTAPKATVKPFIDGQSFTTLVSETADAWHTNGLISETYAPLVETEDGRSIALAERYVWNAEETGTMLWQEVTGLENATYTVVLYANACFTPGRGFNSSVTEGQTGIAYVYANDQKQYVPVHVSTTVGTHGEFTLTTDVTDGTLRLGLVAEQIGTNWWSIQIKSLTKSPTLTYQSSNPEVATVNSSTGAVTIKKAGTTTITATYAGNDNYSGSSASYTLTVEAPQTLPGDANGDNKVNGTDIVVIANMVLGRKDKNVAADANQDGKVNGTDIVVVANIVLGRSSAPVRKAPSVTASGSATLSIEPFDITAGSEATMTIDLNNPDDVLTLVQFDLTLPKGLSVKTVGGDYDIDMAGRTSWRKHSLDANLNDGFYTFLLKSDSNTPIDGTSGGIITVTLVADATFDGGKIVIDNTVLTTPEEVEINPARYEYSLGGNEPTPVPEGTCLFIEPFDITAGSEATMTIDLNNPDDVLTLVQFDLTLPKGLSVKTVGGDYDIDMAGRTSWRKHSLDANLNDGYYTFLLKSDSNTPIDGTSGGIITVTLVADATFAGGKIVIDNTVLTTPEEVEINPVRYEYSLEGATAIEGAEIVKTDDGFIYDLSGRRVTDAKYPGIYIRNGKKFYVK
ncbi:MAG: Ig-like domain-containing protein [Bacteroidales bacterium]|nr:Ig-like domain-containing protein [Bacteroidales bacterium]